MTRARAALAAAAMAVAGLLAGCSAGDEAPPGPSSTSQAPTSAVTQPPISPRTTVSVGPGTLPSASTVVPVPIPTDPQR